MRRVLKYITPYWQFKAILLTIIVSTFLEILTPSVIGGVIDTIGEAVAGNPLGTGGSYADVLLLPVARWLSSSFVYDLAYSILGVYVISILVIALLIALLNYLSRYISAWVTQKAVLDMRTELYNSLLEQSFSFYDQQRTGQLMARATGDISIIERFYDMGIRMIVSTTLLLTLVVYTLFTLNVELTLITLVSLPFIFFTVWSFARRVGPIWQKIREQYGDLTSVIQENLMGIRVVRGFAQESQEESKAIKEFSRYFDTNITVTKLRAFFLPLATLITSIGSVAIIWYGGGRVMQGSLSIGGLIAFYFYVARVAQPVRMLGQITAMTIRANAASIRVFEVIDAEVAVHDKPDAITLNKLKGQVVFDTVSFSYDGKSKVLDGVNIRVEPGQTIAVLGSTGSGKSSIINLIPRFYDATEGSIKIDGVDVRDIKVKSLREQVGIVRQDPFIFSTTFRENIAFGVENSKLEDIIAAAEKAKIHSYISSLPEGYDTRVGERGITVSGGQKQRIAIARALLKNPKILILDDSTSSVDTQTEHEIQEALDKLLENRTTFIITQRLSSIKKADYIIVLEGGIITEEGTHKELISRDGVYRRLYDTQTAGGEEMD